MNTIWVLMLMSFMEMGDSKSINTGQWSDKTYDSLASCNEALISTALNSRLWTFSVKKLGTRVLATQDLSDKHEVSFVSMECLEIKR